MRFVDFLTEARKPMEVTGRLHDRDYNAEPVTYTITAEKMEELFQAAIVELSGANPPQLIQVRQDVPNFHYFYEVKGKIHLNLSRHGRIVFLNNLVDRVLGDDWPWRNDEGELWTPGHFDYEMWQKIKGSKAYRDIVERERQALGISKKTRAAPTDKEKMQAKLQELLDKRAEIDKQIKDLEWRARGRPHRVKFGRRD